jgi:putative addiction module component (TIGR02574 family)
MSPTMKSLGIDRLSVAERIALVQEIWDSIAAAPDQLPLTEAQKKELDRRLAAHQANSGEAIPWEVVRDEALARLRQ